MKNTIKTLAIIAFVAIIGFSFTACGGDDGGDGGGGGKVPEALQGTWKEDGMEYYLVFTKDSFGTGQTVAAATESCGGFIATSDNGSKIEFEHKDYGKDVTGSITYSISGTTLTVSASTGGGTFQAVTGTWIKQ